MERWNVSSPLSLGGEKMEKKARNGKMEKRKNLMGKNLMLFFSFVLSTLLVFFLFAGCWFLFDLGEFDTGIIILMIAFSLFFASALGPTLYDIFFGEKTDGEKTD